MDDLFDCIKNSAQSIVNPRFYETERGFQGQLIAEMNNRYDQRFGIIEQEYQKKIVRHLIAIRPDIIVHQPFDEETMMSRREGNKVVIELKLKGSKGRCHRDFNSLSEMCDKLDYQLAVFINISSSRTYLESYRGRYKDRIRAFGVVLEGGVANIYES